MPRSIPSATCRHSATPEAVSCMLMVRKCRGTAIGKIILLSRNSHGSFAIKLSNIIDNLIPARRI